MVQKTGKGPQIIFCTRTHSQAQQLVQKELRGLSYLVDVVHLGSRNAGLCANPQVRAFVQSAKPAGSQQVSGDVPASQGASGSNGGSVNDFHAACSAARGNFKKLNKNRPADIHLMNKMVDDAEFLLCGRYNALGNAGDVTSAHSFMRNHHAQTSQLSHRGQPDIEDVGNFLGDHTGGGSMHEALCPYFMQKVAADTAHLIVCPYNYVVSPRIAKAMSLNLQDKIIVIDEAHNFDGNLREAGSFVLEMRTFQEHFKFLDCDKYNLFQDNEREGLARVRERLQHCMKVFRNYRDEIIKKNTKYKDRRGQERMPDVIPPNPDYPRTEPFTRHEGIPLGIKTPKDNNDILAVDIRELKFEQGLMSRPYNLVPEVLRDTQLVYQTGFMIETLDKCAKQLDMESGKKIGFLLQVAGALDYFAEFAQVLDNLSRFPRSYSELYEVRRTAERQTASRCWKADELWEFKASFLLNNPEVLADRLDDCHSIILASGTLSPVGGFVSELGTKFKQRCSVDGLGKKYLSTSHVVDKSQLLVTPVAQDAAAVSFKCSTRNLKPNRALMFRVGLNLAEFLRRVPGGTLVFFGSSSMLEAAKGVWESFKWSDGSTHSIRAILEGQIGTVIYEDKANFKRDREAFKEAVERDGRAVFIGYCRGRMSEGLSLPNNYVRSAVIIGVPFPSLGSWQIKFKKWFNKRQKQRDPEWDDDEQWL